MESESHDQSALNPVVPDSSISEGMGYMARVLHNDRGLQQIIVETLKWN